MRSALSGLALALAFSVTTPARADKMSETLDISLSARAAWLEIHREMDVAPAAEGMDLLTRSRPHLHGVGPLMGGTGRIGFTLDGVRFGAGVGVVTAASLDFLHQPLGDGLSVESGPLWGAPFEAYLGYTIGEPDEVRGLLELRGALTVLQTSVIVKDAVLGTLGDTPLNVYLANLEIRAGIRVPVGKLFYFEGGIGLSPLPAEIGPERGSLFFTIGLPVPTSHAF